ncbi:MAG: protein BatD [bacterium]|nr:protein BatD [bacterium]
MKKNRIFIFTALLAVLLLAAPLLSRAEEIEVKASINANKIGIDDVLLYTLTFKGINNPAHPELAGLTDFKVVQTSRSSQFRIINGVSAYYINFVYYLMPLNQGKLTVDAMQFDYKGKTYETEPFKVDVVKGSIAPKQQQRRKRMPSIFDSDDDFFSDPFRRSQPRKAEVDVRLQAVVTQKKAVIGQQIVYRVRLYSRNQIRQVNMVSNQSFPGFWQEWFPTPNQIGSQTKTINGKTYRVYEIRKAILFPTRTGSITIPSLRFELALLDNSSFFANTRKISRNTQEVTVEISPFPTEAAGLPAGNFQFSVIPGKNEININDILTIRVKVTARKGNIKTLEIPEFKTGDYYKIYPAKLSKKNSFANGSFTGVMDAEVPVSFKKSGIISFPALEFSYYNTDTRRVVNLTSNPFNIRVEGVKEKQESAVSIPQTEIIQKGEDIDFIKKGLVYDEGLHYYKTGLYTILLAVFFAFNTLFLLKILLFDHLIAGSSLLKKKKLLNKTISNLNHVKGYSDISPVLEEYLTEKSGIGLSEINNHTIETLFSKYRVNDADIAVFIKIKADSELSRFAPQNADRKPTKEEGRKLKHDLKQLIEILKRIDGRIK